MRNLFFILLAITAFTFTSCKKDKETAPQLTGLWKWESAVSEDDTFEPEDLYIDISADKIEEFYKEDQFLIFQNGANYTLSGSTLTLTDYLFDGGVKAGIVKFVNNDTIEIKITEGETDYVIHLKREDATGLEKVYEY